MSRLPPALLLIATMSAAHADEVVIYRCVDAAGALAIQNMPCPPGTRQSRRVMQAPQPAVVPMPPAPLQAQAAPLPSHVPGPVRPTPTPEPGPPPVPAPPPPLFQCSSRDGGQYLQEDPEPVPRCVPLRTVGLDGNRGPVPVRPARWCGTDASRLPPRRCATAGSSAWPKPGCAGGWPAAAPGMPMAPSSSACWPSSRPATARADRRA